MSSSSDTSSSSSMMTMVFATSTTTPLFSSSWTPSTTGQYAGTCIFLIVLACISRFLGAWRHFCENRWHDKAINRRYVVVAGKDEDESKKVGKPGESEEAVLTVRGVDENVKVVKTKARDREGIPFRFSVDLPRSCIFTMQAGVGYLL